MKRVCIDFDGVIHSYTSGWIDAATIPDPPVEGIKDVLRDLCFGYKYNVCIFSTRAATVEGRNAIWSWLTKHELDSYIHEVRNDKPPAVAYIDDRAIHFDPKDVKGFADRVFHFVEGE